MERRLLVLYGSETGNAQELAERIGRDGTRRHFQVEVCSMNSFPISKLTTERLVIFTCATTGQGDEPENMKMFWNFLLRKNLPTNSLEGINFAVAALGDSSYPKFNFAGKRLCKRLLQLGARPLLPATPVALADDQHDLGPSAIIEPWLVELWKKVLDLFPIPLGMEIIADDVLLPPKYKVIYEKDFSRNYNENVQMKNVKFLGSLVSNERQTTADHFQDVRLITFDIEHAGFTYSPGDVLMVQPSNLDENVEEFINLLHLNPKDKIMLEPLISNAEVPDFLQKPCSIYECVKNFLDIQSIPQRYFFELLLQFTSSELEKEKLRDFIQPENQEELFDYCYRPRRTILEALQDFPNAVENIPFEYIFDLVPSIKPRAFSIASSQLANPNRVQILVAVVKYKTRLHKPRLGLCSNWLARLSPGNLVPIWVKKGTFKFPVKTSVPKIMVGPGTGCAPFQSYLQEQRKKNIGGNVLFFGCRNKEKDFFFADYWTELKNEGLLELFTAFSRDQEHKVYVQHCIREQGEGIWKLLHEGEGYFFIAGNAKDMPSAVLEALEEVFIKVGSMTSEEAKRYLKELDQKNRLQQETWS